MTRLCACPAGPAGPALLGGECPRATEKAARAAIFDRLDQLDSMNAKLDEALFKLAYLQRRLK
jgi:hypothetical protein